MVMFSWCIMRFVRWLCWVYEFMIKIPGSIRFALIFILLTQLYPEWIIMFHVRVTYVFKKFGLWVHNMMQSLNGKNFRVTGPLCREFNGHRWIPLTKAQWRGPFISSLICTWTNGWANNRYAGDYDVTVRNILIKWAQARILWNM